MFPHFPTPEIDRLNDEVIAHDLAFKLEDTNAEISVAKRVHSTVSQSSVSSESSVSNNKGMLDSKKNEVGDKTRENKERKSELERKTLDFAAKKKALATKKDTFNDKLDTVKKTLDAVRSSNTYWEGKVARASTANVNRDSIASTICSTKERNEGAEKEVESLKMQLNVVEKVAKEVRQNRETTRKGVEVNLEKKESDEQAITTLAELKFSTASILAETSELTSSTFFKDSTEETKLKSSHSVIQDFLQDLADELPNKKGEMDKVKEELKGVTSELNKLGGGLGLDDDEDDDDEEEEKDPKEVLKEEEKLINECKMSKAKAERLRKDLDYMEKAFEIVKESERRIGDIEGK